MATLTRKFLTSLGLEDDKVDAIIEKHTEVTTELKDERDRYKEEAEKMPSIQKELETLKKKAEEPDGKDKELKELKDKLEGIEKEYADYKNGIQAKETKAKKESAKRSLLKEAGVGDKFIDLIMKASAEDLEKLELDADGKIKDADGIKETYTKSYADFITTQQTKGAETATPPASNGGKATPSRAAELFQKHSAEMYGAKTKEE